MIEEMAANSNMSLIDTIVNYCDKTGIEIESVSLLITNTLKAKIEVEAVDMHAIKGKSNRLVI